MSASLSVIMPGDCTLRAIRTLHGEVAAALASTADLTLDCTGVARADIAFVQLVVSAAVTAERGAKRLTVAGAPDVVQDAFARAGLSTQTPFLRAA